MVYTKGTVLVSLGQRWYGATICNKGYSVGQLRTDIRGWRWGRLHGAMVYGATI